MTPKQEMDQIMQEISDGLLSISENVSHLSRETGIPQLALNRVIYRLNKNGCSLYVAIKVLRYLRWKLQLVKQPPSPTSRGVSPHENDSNHVST